VVGVQPIVTLPPASVILIATGAVIMRSIAAPGLVNTTRPTEGHVPHHHPQPIQPHIEQVGPKVVRACLV
jgi:hypothetical protein